jgi:hypothetical protein
MNPPLPAQHRSGDTFSVTRSYADYPASEGWSVSLTLVGSGSVYTVTSSADGDDHVVSATAAATGAWASGRYTVVEYVSKSLERYTLSSSVIEILPDLAAATAGQDTRSHARKVLDAIETFLGTGSITNASLEFNGRRLQHIPIPDLIALRDKYRAEVRRESNNGRVGGRLLVRF